MQSDIIYWNDQRGMVGLRIKRLTWQENLVLPLRTENRSFDETGSNFANEMPTSFRIYFPHNR